MQRDPRQGNTKVGAKIKSILKTKQIREGKLGRAVGGEEIQDNEIDNQENSRNVAEGNPDGMIDGTA